MFRGVVGGLFQWHISMTYSVNLGATYRTVRRVLKRRGLKCCFMPLLPGCLAASAFAASDTWLGNAGTNWSAAANWSGGSLPAAGDSLVFTNAGSAGTGLNNDLPAGPGFSGLTFSTNASAFILSGNAFGLNGAIVNSSTNVQTINTPIILTNAGTVNAAVTNLLFGGAISDKGSNCSLTLTGGKGVTLSGSNTFGGTLALNNGVALTIGSAANLGAGTNLSFGGSSGSSLLAGGSVFIPASMTITVGSGSVASFATLTAGTVFEVAGKLTGAGAVSRKSSSYSLGTVRFSNDTSDYAGDFGLGFGNTEFTSVNNQGVASSLGKGAAGTHGQITLGNSSSSGTFRYVGAANSSTTRPLNWTATTGGFALDVTNTGTIAYLAAGNLKSGSGSAVLTLQGSNPGTNTLAQTINDNGGATSLVKSGPGTWVLAGLNTFSGGVNLNGGLLQVDAAENAGSSGPLGKGGGIAFGGGMLQFSSANTFDYSPRFSTGSGQAYAVDTAGQTVAFASPLTSANGSLTISSSAPGGELILTKTNTFSGNTTVLGGTLSVTADACLGTNINTVVLNGGTLLAATNFTLNYYRTVALGAATGDGDGTLAVPAGVALKFDGNLADNGPGSGSLIKTGPGTLAISTYGESTYTGNTTISNGTLSISGSGTIGAANNLVIAAGATLDVSGVPNGYTLAAGQTLTAGNGTSFLNGRLNLGSAALVLCWSNGVPSLTVSGSKLVMSNNGVTVTAAGSQTLPVGLYKIISKGLGGSVSGTVSSSSVTVNGAGALAGASLQIISGELYLNVHGSNPTTITLGSSASTETYGEAVMFTAGVNPASATGSVTFTDGTTTYGTVPVTGGQAALALAGGSLGAGSYPMTASYSGDSTYGPSVSSVVTQTVYQATLTVAANNLSRWTSRANPSLTAGYIGFVAGDTAAVLSGTPNLATAATPASPVGSYPIIVTQGTLTNVTGNYELVFSNGILSVIASVMPYPQGAAFPLMMYEVGDAPSAATVAGYGWNVIQNYGLSTDGDIDAFLQLASSNSLGGDAPIPCNGSATTNFVEWPQAEVQAWIQGSMTNSNIAWWDMPEEMRSWQPTEVQLLRDYRAWVQLFDAGRRPTYEYTPNSRTATNQIGVVTNVDIVAVGCYCEAAGQPHAWVRYKVQEAGLHAVQLGGRTIGSNYLSGQKTVVADLYCATNSSGTVATPQQCYHDVWSAIASGAQGIEVYAYWHAINDTPSLTNNLQQYDLAAAQISGSEIGQAILYGAPVTNLAFTITSGPTNTDSFQPGDGAVWQYPSVNVLGKIWANNFYLIAVNSTSNTVTANFTNLPVTSGTASLPFEMASVTVAGGGFADTFGAWGVHVYKLPWPVVPPVIASISVAGGAATLQCSGSSNGVYALQRSTNLANPAGWVSVATNTGSRLGWLSFTNSASAGPAFYRLLAQ